MSSPRAQAAAQEAFDKGLEATRYSDPDLTPENEEATTHFARVVVEKCVAMHCGVSASVKGAYGSGVDSYGAIDLATGDFRNVRDLVPNRMRLRDWALGFRTACRLGWFEGIYADPAIRSGGNFWQSKYVSAVSPAGLAACLVTAERYREDAARILSIGEVWGETMERLRSDLKILQHFVQGNEVLRGQIGAASGRSLHCPPGAEGAAEISLRELITLHAQSAEVTRAHLDDSGRVANEAWGVIHGKAPKPYQASPSRGL